MEVYFDKNEVVEYTLSYPCKKSPLITELRKMGDIKNQYVTNVYYLDTLHMSDDDISSTYNGEYRPVFSFYHSDCDHCKEYIKEYKSNLIVGFKIYPVGVIPKKTYKQRKNKWLKYRPN